MEHGEESRLSLSEETLLRQDMETFIGPNSRVYLKQWDKWEGDVEKVKFSWLWPAFFMPDIWLIYRKLYLVFLFIYLFVLPVVYLIYPPATLVLSTLLRLFFATMGKLLYLQRVKRIVVEIRKPNLSDNEIHSEVLKKGGVATGFAIALACMYVVGIFATLVPG